MTRKRRNKLIKMTHGNRKGGGRGMKLMAWNNGKSLLQNGLLEIEVLVSQHLPDVYGLSEANLIDDVNTIES